MIDQKAIKLIKPYFQQSQFCFGFTAIDLTKTEWRMRKNMVDMPEMKKLFQSIQAAGCIIIYADINYRETILQQICLPRMRNLQILDIGNNNIQSVQSLRRAVMPNLAKLWINGNFITSVQSLMKSILPKLRVLWLSNNKIQEINFNHSFWPGLTELYLYSNRLNSVESILKADFPSIKWAKISSDEDSQQINQILVARWQGNIRWKFKSVEMMWMPLFYMNMGNRIKQQNTPTPQ